jgi:hypothetical protein
MDFYYLRQCFCYFFTILTVSSNLFFIKFKFLVGSLPLVLNLLWDDCQLSTKDIIIVLKDTLNTTLGPLPIPDPHATGLPSNTLKKHLIGSLVVDGIHDLVTSSNMAKLVGSPTSDSTFTYQKGAKNTSLVDFLLSKDIVDSHSLHKVSHSFLKVLPSERTSIATIVTIVDNIESAI